MKYRIVSDSSSNVFHMEDIDYRTVPLKVIMNEGEFFDDERTNVERFLSVLGQVHLMVPIRFLR